MKKKIGVILAFRSSPEVEDFVKFALDLPGNRAEILVRGSQDHLTDDELKAMTEGYDVPMYGDQLKDGTMVYLRKEDLLANMRVADKWLRERGCTTTMVFCANDYSELMDIENMVLPGELVINNALALVPKGGTIGVINPIEASAPYEIRKWDRVKEMGYKIVNTLAAPIIPDSPDLAMMSEEEIAAAAGRPVEAALEMKEQGADIIILDCLGVPFP